MNESNIDINVLHQTIESKTKGQLSAKSHWAVFTADWAVFAADLAHVLCNQTMKVKAT